jgi:hypothetical protein
MLAPFVGSGRCFDATGVPAAIRFIKRPDVLFVHSMVNFIQILLRNERMLVSTETSAQSGRAFKTAF